MYASHRQQHPRRWVNAWHHTPALRSLHSPPPLPLQAKLTHAEQSGVSGPRIHAARVAYYSLAFRDGHEHLTGVQEPAPE